MRATGAREMTIAIIRQANQQGAVAQARDQAGARRSRSEVGNAADAYLSQHRDDLRALSFVAALLRVADCIGREIEGNQALTDLSVRVMRVTRVTGRIILAIGICDQRRGTRRWRLIGLRSFGRTSTLLGTACSMSAMPPIVTNAARRNDAMCQ